MDPNGDNPETLYDFDWEVTQYIGVLSGLIVGCPSITRLVELRTRILNTACIDLLFKLAIWSLPMFMVVFDFVQCRTNMFYVPNPAAALLFAGNPEYLHRFPPEITAEIFSHMSVQVLRSLGATCRFYHKLVDDMLNRHLNRLVTPFGVPFNHLRYVLDATDSIISGSVALLALFPGSRFEMLFDPGDLDIYTTRTQYTHLIRFFSIYAGYTISTEAGQEYFRLGMILRVFRLIRAGSSLSINIIVSLAENSMMPVFRFHSTLVMNFVSGRGTGVFSAYIEATTAFKGVVNSAVFNLKTAHSIRSLHAILVKYQHRGFTILDLASDMPHTCTRDALCPSTVRSMLDQDSFFMKLQRPVAGSRAVNRVWNPRDVLVWALGGVACPGRGLGRIGGFVRRCSPTVTNPDMVDWQWKMRMARIRRAEPSLVDFSPTGRLIEEVAPFSVSQRLALPALNIGDNESSMATE
ncbi:hypothetical protein C8R43DRAFT_960430 [Mycena crocata]|nr:hypothetical protein C8R43DRAFT_960430 [Mycena crocata]